MCFINNITGIELELIVGRNRLKFSEGFNGVQHSNG